MSITPWPVLSGGKGCPSDAGGRGLLSETTGQALEVGDSHNKLWCSCLQWRCSLAQGSVDLNPERIGTGLWQHQCSENDAELNESQRNHFIPTVPTLLGPCASLRAYFWDEMQTGGMKQPRDGPRTPLGYPPHHIPASPQCWCDGEGWSTV